MVVFGLVLFCPSHDQLEYKRWDTNGQIVFNNHVRYGAKDDDDRGPLSVGVDEGQAGRVKEIN